MPLVSWSDRQITIDMDCRCARGGRVEHWWAVDASGVPLEGCPEHHLNKYLDHLVLLFEIGPQSIEVSQSTRVPDRVFLTVDGKTRCLPTAEAESLFAEALATMRALRDPGCYWRKPAAT